MKNLSAKTPPGGLNEFKNVPLIHNVSQFYKNIYQFSDKISKRDRFGIYLKIENSCLDILDLIIEAALETKENKPPLIAKARIKIEKTKRLIRILQELKIIESAKYLQFQSDLQEISKETNNWLSYLKKIAKENPAEN